MRVSLLLLLPVVLVLLPVVLLLLLLPVVLVLVLLLLVLVLLLLLLVLVLLLLLLLLHAGLARAARLPIHDCRRSASNNKVGTESSISDKNVM